MAAKASKTDVPIDPKQIGGLKRLHHILPLLASLHEVGCERDRAGNRELHFDEYVTLVLLALFNPILDSVRALQNAKRVGNRFWNTGWLDRVFRCIAAMPP